MEYITYDFQNCIEAQKQIAPSVYGKLDLDFVPERFINPLQNGRGPKASSTLLTEKQVELYRQSALMGDPFADELAAVMMDDLGIQRGKALFNEALEKGIVQVPEAPPAMVRFFEHLERIPDWLDMDLIEYRTAKARLKIGCFMELFTRGHFAIVYEDDHSALPMVITGRLTNEGAARRMRDTSSLTRATAFPGSMLRGGVGFRQFAKVRLAHAMVRVNLLRSPKTWNLRKYGVPLSQTDSPGPVNLAVYALAKRRAKQGKPATKLDKAEMMYWRYMGYLNGVHDYHCSSEFGEIIEKLESRSATHRVSKMPSRYIPVIQANLNCYMRRTHTLWDRFIDFLDRKAAKAIYSKFVGEKAAAEFGVTARFPDKIAFMAHAAIKFVEYGTVELIGSLPGGRPFRERYADRKLKMFLDSKDFDAVDTHTEKSDYKLKIAA